MATPQYHVFIGQLQNGFQARNRWNARVYFGTDDLDGEVLRISGGLSVRPSTRWQLSVTPNYLRVLEQRQYVATLDSGPAVTYDGRYLFARVDQSELRLSLRANYTITPDLSFELYAEPFASSGRYYDLGELASPKSIERITYGRDAGTQVALDADGNRTVTWGADSFSLSNRDFNTTSFQSNVVLRWEWRPGSTLYLVWQQDRDRTDPIGERVSLGDVFGSVSEPGTNIFLVKASFWLPVG